MKWYNDMNEQEKRSFKKVITICVVGAILRKYRTKRANSSL